MLVVYLVLRQGKLAGTCRHWSFGTFFWWIGSCNVTHRYAGGREATKVVMMRWRQNFLIIRRIVSHCKEITLYKYFAGVRFRKVIRRFVSRIKKWC
jgi:hypothetical protein